jgi:hypothetical protein
MHAEESRISRAEVCRPFGIGKILVMPEPLDYATPKPKPPLRLTRLREWSIAIIFLLVVMLILFALFAIIRLFLPPPHG